MSALSIVAIIPLYNGARWIEGSIRSVLNQTLPPDEFIVVDDGSTDEGPAIVAELAGKHQQITLLHKPNGGQSSARNYGVAHSTSALIALLDQDDAWYPHHLKTLVRPFGKSGGIPLGWTYSNLDEIDESGGIVHRNFHDFLPRLGVHSIHPKTSLADCLSNDMFILPSASLIAREAFEAVGGFDEELCGYEDDDLFLRLFRAGYRDVYINQALSQWRIYSTSTSYTSRMAKSRMIYGRKLLRSYPDNWRQHRFWARQCIAPRFLRHAILNFAAALEHRDSALFRASVDHLHVLWPHLRIRHRIVAAGLMLCARTGLIRAVYGARDFVWPVVRLLTR